MGTSLEPVGAFLAPYRFWVVVCGIPLLLPESSLGQYTQEGLLPRWRKASRNWICTTLGKTRRIYCIYIIIQAWALFYLVFCRSERLWATCKNTRNTAYCRGLDYSIDNHTANQTMLPNTNAAATEFLERRALGMSRDIKELGSVRWELTLCLLGSWVSGTVSNHLERHHTFPYVMLLIIRGVTLPGAGDGIYYYMYPDLDGLANIVVETQLNLVVPSTQGVRPFTPHKVV